MDKTHNPGKIQPVPYYPKIHLKTSTLGVQTLVPCVTGEGEGGSQGFSAMSREEMDQRCCQIRPASFPASPPATQIRAHPRSSTLAASACRASR